MVEADLDRLAAALAWCRRQANPFDAHNDVILGRCDYGRRLHDGSYLGQYWRAQKEICAALWDDTVTTVAVPAGHSVGKSYVASGVIPGWLELHPDSLIVSTSPSNDQLSGVLWKEIRRAHNGSPLRPLGRITGNPEKLDFGNGHHALGFSTNKPERAQGHHCRGPLLVVVDEASGVEDPDIWATLTSLKPQKRLLISNPLRPDGPFYDICQRAETDPSVRLIHVPSLASPDIELERSERGLADAAWLREMRADYGEGTLVWKVRVEALFPDDATDSVFLRRWVEDARKAVHKPAIESSRRIAVDLALGNGGDDTVIFVADFNGVLLCESDKTWDLGKTAERVAAHAVKFGVTPDRVSFDVEGIGADFGNRLRQNGLEGCVPYRGGGAVASPKYANTRALTAWRARQRLNPEHFAQIAPGAMVPQTPYSLARMPDEDYKRLRKELRELRYTLGPTGGVVLEKAEDYAKRLKHSPDHQAAFCQLFM